MAGSNEPPQANTISMHASTVAIAGKAVVIRGASGSGKSSLALQLMSLGAHLIADDRTVVERSSEARLIASCPSTIRGQIEARGIGILAADPAPPCIISLVVDLDQIESERLPHRHKTEILGVLVECIHKSDSPHFAAAVLQYASGVRLA